MNSLRLFFASTYWICTRVLWLRLKFALLWDICKANQMRQTLAGDDSGHFGHCRDAGLWRETAALCRHVYPAQYRPRDLYAAGGARLGGAKVIERLAKDLQVALPTMKGFSRSNLMYMRAIHEEWGQNLLLLTKLKSREERLWYAERAVTHGWSRNVMWHHMSTQLQQRTG